MQRLHNTRRLSRPFDSLTARLIRDALIGLGIAISLWTAGCAATVYPKAVEAHAVAFDKNTQNAGVSDCDAKGCIVTAGWIARYHAMETEFKATVPADSQIAAEGSNYRVSYEVSNHFASMRAAQRGP
jgi:hypothetical protein